MTGHSERINALALIDHDKCIFASCSDDKTIRMWDYGRGGTQIKCFEGHRSQVYDILKYNNEALISASGDTTIKIWSIKHNYPVKTLTGHKGDVFTLSDVNIQLIASGSSDMTVKLWYVENF